MLLHEPMRGDDAGRGGRNGPETFGTSFLLHYDHLLPSVRTRKTLMFVAKRKIEPVNERALASVSS